MAHDLLFDHTLAELELVHAVDEVLLCDVVADPHQRLAFDRRGSVLTRVEHIFQTEDLVLAENDQARDPHVVLRLSLIELSGKVEASGQLL